jgi:hypothetical protein
MNKLTIVAVTLALAAPAQAHSVKPLTPSQVQTYQDLIDIGITKKDAERVARDPGVKEGEWGWVCEGGGGKLMRPTTQTRVTCLTACWLTPGARAAPA